MIAFEDKTLMDHTIKEPGVPNLVSGESSDRWADEREGPYPKCSGTSTAYFCSCWQI